MEIHILHFSKTKAIYHVLDSVHAKCRLPSEVHGLCPFIPYGIQATCHIDGQRIFPILPSHS